MKVLGFWAKLFKKCVEIKDYQLLSDSVEDLNKNIAFKEKVITDLKDELSSKAERIRDLVQQVNKADNQVIEVTTKYDAVAVESKNLKDIQEVTLKLLSDAETENKKLKQQLENRPVVTEECECGGDDKEPNSKEEECLPIEDVVGDGTFEKEDVLKGADVVVTGADKLQNFVNGLSRVQMTELKDDILKGHKNDKRLTTTLKNWIKKFPDRLETQVYFMFKTALTRRRGKQQLGAWYFKFDDMK